ncbi:MAG TPA: flap endonuclease-1 [Candidatus Bathyarchaeia archaeon]|nr:flap endonuclease-1 [Candidatus Bathyarchaeia archaeon]
MLTPILKREQTSLKALRGTSFAIDASIEIHQFLALVRKRDGSLFTDSQGRVTSHLIGLITRTSRLIAEFDMKPVFVFDGKPNPLKRRTIEMRREARKKAEVEYVEAVSKKDYSKAWSKAVMTGRITGSVLDDSKHLLNLMGIPWLEALEDAEAQASYMAARGDVWAVGSKDYDCLLYGAPILARYLTLTGREWLPAQKRSRPLIPELIKLSENLALLRITREQLVDLAILVGTDFNEGVKGVGPKKALRLVLEYGSIEQMPEGIRSKLTEDLNSVRQLFLKPRVLEKYVLKRSQPDREGLVKFLAEERAFNKERVERLIGRLPRGIEKTDAGLENWLN